MTPDELQERARAFSLRILKLSDILGTGGVASRELARQLVRSGMSVSANYRAARRARSKKEFTAKLGIVVEETDEVAHWLDLVAAGGYVPVSRLGSLQREVNELLAIYSRMARTARARLAAGTKVGAPESIATSPFRQITT